MGAGECRRPCGALVHIYIYIYVFGLSVARAARVCTRMAYPIALPTTFVEQLIAMYT